MTRRSLSWILIPVALAISSVALGEEPAPAAKSGEVQQLQKQLEQMSRELADLKKLVEGGDMPAQQRQRMMNHMGRMQGHMHGMMSDCCAMDPSSCPAHMR
jgi:hypothetical protein